MIETREHTIHYQVVFPHAWPWPEDCTAETVNARLNEGPRYPGPAVHQSMSFRGRLRAIVARGQWDGNDAVVILLLSCGCCVMRKATAEICLQSSAFCPNPECPGVEEQ